MKKILAILIIIALTSSFCFTAFAEENIGHIENNSEEEVPIDEKEEEKEDEAEEDEAEENNTVAPLPEADIRTTALNTDEIIVTTNAELRTALTEDNGYTTIYLGADITLGSTAMVPHVNKKSITIDGISPDDPGVTHVLTDATSATNINITSNTGTKDVLLRNLYIIGRNYYGTIYVSNSARDVTVTYQNVMYSGPQMLYNHYGTIVLDNTTVDIHARNGGSSANELAEVTNVLLKNKVNITHEPSALSIFYCSWQNGYFTVEPNAEVTIQKASTYALYYSDSYRHSFTLGENAIFNYTNTYTAGTLYSGFTQTALASFHVAEGAQFYINTSNAATDALLTVQGPVYIAADAIFEINGRSTYGSLTVTGGNTVEIANPKRFLIHNTTGRTIRYGTAGQLNISGQQINNWTVAGAGDLNDPPLNSWKKGDKSSFYITGTVSAGASGTFTAISSNYTEGDSPGTAPSSATFNISTTRVLAVGSLLLHVDDIYEGYSAVSGRTDSNTNISVDYSMDGEEKAVTGTTDALGIFSIETGEQLPKNTEIKITANQRYLFGEVSAVILENGGELLFSAIPQDLEFRNSEISAKHQIIPRVYPDYAIHISDTRTGTDQWKLDAELLQVLTPSDQNAAALPNALIYINSSGTKYILNTDEAVTIYQSTQENQAETVLQWEADKGFLIELLPGEGYANTNYTAVIQWTLLDVPQ